MEIIKEEVTISGFGYSELFGAYAESEEVPSFYPEEGQVYTIRWDGVEYVRTAFSFLFGGTNECVGIGNPLPAGQPDNGDTFCIVLDKTLDHLHYISTETAESHTVAVYLGSSAQDRRIILKDRDGTPVTHEGVTGGINVLRPDGTEALYVDSEGVPEPVEATIEADWSGGDMVVTPEEGKVFSAIIIPKPETAIPENIREGINLAGIVGTLPTGGGESGPIVFATGSVAASASASAVTITHGLGVVPDIAVIFPKAKLTTASPIMYCYNFSAAMYAKAAGALSGYLYTPNMSLPLDAGTALDTADTLWGYLANADEQKMSVGGSLKLEANKNYEWIAIGGLT